VNVCGLGPSLNKGERVPYLFEYTEEARAHLRGLTAAQRSLVLDTLQDQLTHQPTEPTRNRKPMFANRLLADWELRIRNLRVFYNVYEEPEQVVSIRAIGTKKGNKLFILGEEMQL